VFNKETQYALRALVYIQAQNLNGLTPGIIEITNEIEAPQFFTAKILQRLAKNGFVRSQKGKNGGFSFDPAKAELTLMELIVSIEGDTLFCGCGFGLKQCDHNHPCPFHEKYAPIREAMAALVSEETIQNLAKKEMK